MMNKVAKALRIAKYVIMTGLVAFIVFMLCLTWVDPPNKTNSQGINLDPKLTEKKLERINEIRKEMEESVQRIREAQNGK